MPCHGSLERCMCNWLNEHRTCSVGIAARIPLVLLIGGKLDDGSLSNILQSRFSLFATCIDLFIDHLKHIHKKSWFSVSVCFEGKLLAIFFMKSEWELIRVTVFISSLVFVYYGLKAHEDLTQFYLILPSNRGIQSHDGLLFPCVCWLSKLCQIEWVAWKLHTSSFLPPHYWHGNV